MCEVEKPYEARRETNRRMNKREERIGEWMGDQDMERSDSSDLPS